MNAKRAGRYKDKLELMYRRAEQVQNWASETSPEAGSSEHEGSASRNQGLRTGGGSLAGGGIAAKVKNDLEFLKDRFWQEKVLGVLLYGSHARGEAGFRSDIDLCIVAPEVADSDLPALWMEFISNLRDHRYDVRIFEYLPLHLKMAVIEEGIVISSRDRLELCEYFNPFRREWGDQKHRQGLSREEMVSFLRAKKRAWAGHRP